jgi:DinB superfamily
MDETLTALERTVRRLPGELRKFTDEQASERPAPGRWTKKQVIGHLIDSAANNHQRFVRAALAGAVEFPGYDQNQWVDLQQYQQIPWEQLITLWTALNEHLLHVFRQLTPEQWAAQCSGGDRGTRTLEQLLESYVAHLHQHLMKMSGSIA